MKTKTVSIALPKIEGIELKNATVDLKKGVVIAEYREKEAPFEAKRGDFLTLKTDPSKVVIFDAMAGVFGGVDAFTIIYDLPTYIEGIGLTYTLKGVKMPISRFRHSTEEEKALMIEEMEKLGKRYNPETFKIEEKDAIDKMYQEKTLEDYEQMLFKKDSSMTFSPKSAYFSVYGWLKDHEPKLYYTKILQLIADDLHGGRYIHIRGNTSYHLSNAHGVNIHCGGDEGCVYFKSNKLAIKARDILGSKIKYLFNQE